MLVRVPSTLSKTDLAHGSFLPHSGLLHQPSRPGDHDEDRPCIRLVLSLQPPRWSAPNPKFRAFLDEVLLRWEALRGHLQDDQ